MTGKSVNSYCRAIAFFLLLSVFGGWFGEMYVPSLMMTGDPAATAEQLTSRNDLFRLGFAAYLVEACSDIVLAWLFYVLLKPVDRELALLSAFFGLVSTAIFAATKFLYFVAPTFLTAGGQLSAFTPDQLQALASIFLSLYATLSGITLLFYGIGWLLRGYLTYRSGFLPRWLGALMSIAGLGFAMKTITYVLTPAYSPALLLVPMFLNAVAIVVWMLAKGVDEEEWSTARAKL